MSKSQYLSGEEYNALQNRKQENQQVTPKQSPWMWVAIAALVTVIVMSFILFTVAQSNSNTSQTGSQSQGGGGDYGTSAGDGDAKGCSNEGCTPPALPGAKGQPNVRSQ